MKKADVSVGLHQRRSDILFLQILGIAGVCLCFLQFLRLVLQKIFSFREELGTNGWTRFGSCRILAY